MSDGRDVSHDEERITDAFFEAACHHAEDDVARAEVPSFAAIVARAHRIDPAAVPAESVDRARKLARPAGVGSGSGVGSGAARGPTRDDVDAELHAMMLAARDEAEVDIARRAAAGLPPMRPPQRSRSTLRIGVFAACMLAAAAAVVVSLDRFERWRLSQQAQEREGSQSVAQVRDDDGWRATDRTPAPTAPRPAAVAPPWHPPAEPSLLPSPAALESPAPAPTKAARRRAPDRDAGVRVSSPPVDARGPAREVPRESLLERLDREAQAALTAGDREGADRRYAEVIAVGGEHPLVELAFAERFALARGGGIDRRRSLYEGYLARFPEGRFADAAQAGLCRAAANADKRACWADYLQRFPSGAYRAHAERWSPSDETQDPDDAP